jgi:iron complex transport system ATP-binding protein
VTAAKTLQCAGLSCGYHGRAVLSDVDLTFSPGSVSALLGPNGSGKSTLLRTLAGITAPLAGSVSLDGQAVERMDAAARAKRFAFVPQEEAVPFRFSVREVVAMGRIPHSTGLFDTEEDRAAAEDAMAQADCLDLADRPITELSGGEKQRVLIARALAQSGEVLLLDEPTSHLDVSHQLATRTLLRGLAAQGRTILAAVHDLNQASALADYGVLLSGGRIVRHGPMREILESPDLDRVFSATFERVTMANGMLTVLPSGHSA